MRVVVILSFVRQMYDFLYNLPHSHFAINALCFSQDACVLASGDDDGYIQLFDFPLGKELRRLRVATAVMSLLWHPNKPDVILIGDARGIVTVMNLHAEVSVLIMILLGLYLMSILSLRFKVFLLALGLMLQ